MKGFFTEVCINLREWLPRNNVAEEDRGLHAIPQSS